MATAVFALILGIVFAVVGVRYLALARRMRSFERVAGRVIDRQVVLVGDATEGRTGEGGGYTPRVTYRYVVNGAEFTADRTGFAVSTVKRAVAERQLALIPDGVEVWYNPLDPHDAYLERHGPAAGWAILALAVLLVGGALLAMLPH